MVVSIRPPSPKNLNLAVIETMKIVYQKDKKDFYEIKLSRLRGAAAKIFISLFYLIGAAISFGAIFFVLRYFNFPITSIIIDIIFIALILFAGTAVQKRAQELTIEEDSGGFFVFMGDILFLPMATFGKWLSNTWKQYNAIAVFFNALIDMPFSIFVEFIESWRYFIKEKKEEIR
jgi:hypothetical protein